MSENENLIYLYHHRCFVYYSCYYYSLSIVIFWWKSETHWTKLFVVFLHLLKSSARHHHFFSCCYNNDEYIMSYTIVETYCSSLSHDPETPSSNKFQLLFNSSVFIFFSFYRLCGGMGNSSTHTGKVFQILRKSSWVLFYFYCYILGLCVRYVWFFPCGLEETHSTYKRFKSMIHTKREFPHKCFLLRKGIPKILREKILEEFEIMICMTVYEHSLSS